MKKVILILVVLSIIGATLNADELNNTSKYSEKQYYQPYLGAMFIVPFGILLTYDNIQQYIDLDKIEKPNKEITVQKNRRLGLAVLFALATTTALHMSQTKVELPVSYSYDGKTNYLMCEFKF
ncbi:hypothetical protein JEZ13_07930 [bacterium]|nr:hypothetical protein [bacterium]